MAEKSPRTALARPSHGTVEVFEELQPFLERVGRLKELVARVSGDMSFSLEKKVEQTDAILGQGQ